MRIWLDEGNGKTKPIYSYCVLCAAYCQVEFEKTKPISVFRPEMQSTNSQIGNESKGADWAKMQSVRDRFFFSGIVCYRPNSLPLNQALSPLHLCEIH
jgi:hypothetical protein